MKRKSIEALILAGVLAVSATGCASETRSSREAKSDEYEHDDWDDDDDEEDEDKDNEEDEEREDKEESSSSGIDSQTLMVYMVGSNLESQAGAATADLQEMARSGYDSDKLNIVVCAGGANKWWNSSIDEDELKMYTMKDEDVIPECSMDNQNMADPATLKEFINKAKSEYPADSYSLILWNHGGGSVLGYGSDEKHDDEMLSVTQLGEAIGESDVCKEGKFEWIGFDACLMGMVEVADTLKDDADYMIASEEVEAQDGWNYSALGEITDENAYSGDEAGNIITKAYGEYYSNQGFFVPDYTLSCIDMSKVDKVTSAVAGFAEEADEALAHGEYSRIARARDNTKSFGKTGSYSMFDYVDLGCFSNEIRTEYPEKAAKLEKAVNDCVIYNVTNVGRASGLSVYFPYDNTYAMDMMIEKYDAEKYNEKYTSFIHDFAKEQTGEDLAEWTVTDSAPVISDDSDTAYSVQLSDEETQNFSKAYASIWEKDTSDESQESYIYWLDSANTKLSNDGKLSTDFDGRIFYLTDNSGNKVPIFAIQTEVTEDYAEYVTYVTKGELVGETHNDALYFRVDKEHPTGVITGIYRINEADDNELSVPSKQVDTIKDGDHILVQYFARKIKFNDDGSVEPFESWDESSFLGAGIDVEGDLKVTYEKPALEHNYIGLFDIRDTQGKSHYSNYIDVHVDGEPGNGKSVYDEAAESYKN